MADNDIIDFYKKADNDNKPEEPLKEQVETPEPVVSESVAVPVPESNDPFDKFLFNLAEKLKTEKKITEQQQQQFNERVVQPTTNPEDPFAKFLESFAGLVKEDENINKEENIKEATIDFINKLKNDDFFDRDVPKVIPKVKQAKSKSKKYLPPKFAKKVEKVQEEQPVIEQSTEPETEVKQPEQTNNPYLKELQTADKKKNKIEDRISGLSDIKKIIAQQVQEQLSRYPNIGFTGGGGGTNAVQYAEGGTMRGDLNVTGKYLSGGVDISTLFGSGGGGGGYADRFVSGPSQFILDPDGKLHPLDNDLLTLQSENAGLSAFTRIVLSPYAFFAYDNEGNSITFDEVDNAIVLTSRDLHEWTFNSEGKLIGPSGTLAVSGNVDVTNKFLSGGVDLADIFITSAEESQTLAYDAQTELLSITRGNSVSLSSLNDKSYANSNFLKLSGGTISGNLTVQGNISALGTATFANTIFTTTSALSVYNTGPGPALYVYQAAGPYDVASFYDGDGIEVLHVGNAGPGGFGKVGVNESFPNEELTVRGSISATEVIYAENGNSTNWILDGGNTKGTEITIGTNDAYSLNFETSGVTRMTVTDTGNFGFGGTPYARVQYVLENDTDPPQITAWDNRHVQWGTGGAQAPGLGMSYSQSDGTVNMAFLEPNIAWRNARMNFSTMTWYSGGTTLGLTQDSSGNVGVGTTTPSTKLEVTGTIKARKTEENYQDSVLKILSTESAASVSWRGRALIGAEDLTFLMGTYNGIAGLGAHSWSSANDESDAAWADLTINPDGAANTYIGGSGWDNSTAIVTVQNSTTNVGVGTTTPTTKLDVNGTITATGGNSDQWNETYTTVQTNSASWAAGGGGSTEKRFDFVTTGGIDYSYSGTAAQYTIETSPTWKLIRLTYNNNGTISNSASALDSWTGRLTATYV